MIRKLTGDGYLYLPEQSSHLPLVPVCNRTGDYSVLYCIRGAGNFYGVTVCGLLHLLQLQLLAKAGAEEHFEKRK